MNRRTMLSRLLAIPAAVVAIGRMPRTAAAETGAVLPVGDIHLDSYWKGWDARDQADLAPLALDGVVINAGASEGHYLRILNPDGTVKADYPERTFDAMVAECAARGCPLTRETGGWTYVVTHPADNTFGETLLCTDDLDRVDAWRRSLHETG